MLKMVSTRFPVSLMMCKHTDLRSNYKENGAT